jgi:hypothetical protein
MSTMPEPAILPPGPGIELSAAVDDAVAALPERFRSAVVLCDLYELSRAEAAARLGIPEGTLSSRLNTARKRLSGRLARRGVVTTVPLAVAARAAVSSDLAGRAVAVAVAGASGGRVAEGVRSLAGVGGLTMRKLIGWSAASVAVAGLAVGAVAALPGPKEKAPGPPARAAEPKSDPPAKPDGEPAKPARPAKPRLVRTFELSARKTDPPVWSQEGTLLAVEQSSGEVRVYDTRTPDVRSIVDLGPSTHLLGFLTDKATLVTCRATPGRINAESYLQFWDPSAPGRIEKPARTVEFDGSDGRPFAVLPNGKAVLTLTHTRTRRRLKDVEYVGGPAVVRLLDGTSGEAVRELARVEGDLHTVSLSPDGKSLAVVYDRPGGPEKDPGAAPSLMAVVESIGVPDGKRQWVREFKGWQKSGGQYTLRAAYAPDRKWLAVTLQEAASERTIIDGTIRLLNAANGEDGPPLKDQGTEFNTPMSFSHDGRLLVGYVRAEDPRTSLRVWDVRTGRVLKSWDGTALASFAPDRPLLAVLEHTGDGASAVLGFWDLSALTK